MNLDALKAYIIKVLQQIASLDQDLILLAILVVIVVIVIDNFDFILRKRRKETGIARGTVTISIDGSKALPVRNYISEIQRLSGRPDAIVIENGFIIPVERKPLAKKFHDRYVAQLLIYMRLIEEFEGKKPPYGYLILGPNSKRFKIINSEERQAWLQTMLDAMRETINSGKKIATPHPKKCRKCSVNQHCEFRADS